MFFADPSHFRPWIVEHAVDIVRPDAKYGITLTKKVADLCDVFGVKFELHGFGFATCQFANLNIMGACKNTDFFEHMLPDEQYNLCAVDTIKPDKEGFVHMPTKPGLGIEFDFGELRKHTIATL
jgi:L-alanine-DL-glutamate epimerase-like enolase superfamily enzyme